MPKDILREEKEFIAVAVVAFDHSKG